MFSDPQKLDVQLDDSGEDQQFEAEASQQTEDMDDDSSSGEESEEDSLVMVLYMLPKK